MNWFVKVVKQYVDFSGRARRKEYWMFILFYTLFAVIAAALDNLFGIAIPKAGYGPIYGILALALFLPNLGVTVRRLHDTGRSGWMLLLGLIPVVGAIIIFVFLVSDSKVGSNEYGENPKNDIA